LSMEKVQAMAEQVEIKAKVVQTEVKALVLRHKKALEERECELLWKVSCWLLSEKAKHYWCICKKKKML
ncbi:E3 ubiquitin-protein ligase trim71, partial [Xenoophorus captivus]